MMLSDTATVSKRQTTFVLFEVFQRVVASYCLVSGLRYWGVLIGFDGQDIWRFDLMAVHWQVAASSLAVLLPVAAVGLWMPVSWGPVVWFVAASAEIAMYFVFADLFGARPVTVAVHLVTACIYLVFRIVLFLEKRRSRRPVRVDSL